MRKIIFPFLLVFVSQSLLAQIPISRSNNSMRTGDILHKFETDYVNVGEAGLNKVWSLGQITDESKEFQQSMISSNDTIALFDKNGISHYLMHGDTLCYKGNQQRRSYQLFSQGRPVLCYPFQYGDSISGNYAGIGHDDGLDLSVTGWGYSVADGTGVLTDGEDSLLHITRIHMFDDFVNSYAGQADIHIQRHRYLWFCAGYRYPVMETFKEFSIEGSTTEFPLDSATYLYLPVFQSELSTDNENDEVRQYLENTSDIPVTGRDNKENTPSVLSLQANLSADGRTLLINYSLASSCDISIYACDLLGSTLGYVHYSDKALGEWQEHIALSRKPIGNVLMLNIQCNNENMSIKVNQ